MSDRPTRILFLQPWFGDDSFWNYRVTCEYAGKKYPAPPLNLITIAAMLPQTWEFRLVDENVETLRDEDILWADLVMSTAMLPQRPRAMRLIEHVQKLGRPIMLGGPDISSSPDLYAHVDFSFVGEAEGTLPKFVEDWEAGKRSGSYVAPLHVADVTTTPVPRYDLLKKGAYIEMSLQFSRGCPFLCEFCDIIELFGRKPRTKTVPQVLAELDAIYATGHRGLVDFVDDNLIGNKKTVKLALPHIIDWQKRHGYPFRFTTEASLNLADDPDFMELMRQANFMAIFVGIESPDPDILAMTQKKQNTKRHIAESINKIYAHGIGVVGGFIVGFDGEKPGTAEALIELIDEAAIPVAMTGLLVALPNTQLERRLRKEGRLFEVSAETPLDVILGDQCTTGLNFETDRPREEVMADYRKVLATIYDSDAFFGRLREMVRRLDMSGPTVSIM